MSTSMYKTCLTTPPFSSFKTFPRFTHAGVLEEFPYYIPFAPGLHFSNTSSDSSFPRLCCPILSVQRFSYDDARASSEFNSGSRAHSSKFGLYRFLFVFKRFASKGFRILRNDIEFRERRARESEIVQWTAWLFAIHAELLIKVKVNRETEFAREYNLLKLRKEERKKNFSNRCRKSLPKIYYVIRIIIVG